MSSTRAGPSLTVLWLELRQLTQAHAFMQRRSVLSPAAKQRLAKHEWLRGVLRQMIDTIHSQRRAAAAKASTTVLEPIHAVCT